MKVTKAVFKRILKECILELHAEGKLKLPGGEQQGESRQSYQQATLDEVARSPMSPWGGKGPIQANLLRMALEDTMAHEVHRHREIPGGFSMPMPPPMSTRVARDQPASAPPSPGPPQQFPSAQALLTEDGGVNPMAFPGANRWASLAFAKRKPGNQG